MKRLRSLRSSVRLKLTLAGLAVLPTFAAGSVADFQLAASARVDLLHHYTFDGDSDEERRADKKGAAHLVVKAFGSGTDRDLELGVAGFDVSSASVKTTRGPGTDNANGAYLLTDSVTFGEAVSFEVIFQPSEPEISGGNFNLAYILSTRVGGDRGYFLTQGGPLPSTGMKIESTMGNLHSEPNTNTVLSSFTVGNWYYVSGSYTVDGGRVTWTNYVADLTAGETTLTAVGPFTNSGGTYPLTTTPMGVGGRWDGQESFPGFIDEVTFYDAALGADDFQEHLNLIAGTSGVALSVESSADDLVFKWGSQAGKRYNLRSATGLDSEPASWAIFDSGGDLEATPPENTLTLPRPADPERFFVIEEFNPPPVVVFSDDFESGQGDWTVGSDGAEGTMWELGDPAPNVGPTAANSPPNCFGTNLSSNYEIDADIWLRSPVIDLSDAENATLTYFQFADIEEGFDFGRLAVLNAADDTELAVIDDMIDGSSTEWQKVTERLPAEALGKSIVLEFRFQSDEISTFGGWYIDDVEVTVP